MQLILTIGERYNQFKAPSMNNAILTGIELYARLLVKDKRYLKYTYYVQQSLWGMT